jgi:hypothetical protein
LASLGWRSHGSLGGHGLAQQFAQVEEMLLAATAFREVRPLQLGDELAKGIVPRIFS